MAAAKTSSIMDESYDRKRHAHLTDMSMDNSYSHLKVDNGEVLSDMAAMAEKAYPTKALDNAVVAHCGTERLKTGSMWADHCAFRGINISPVIKVGPEQKHRFYARYKQGTEEPLHVHQQATVEWVVLSGRFDVECGPVFDVPGYERVRETLVAGSWFVVPKGQPHSIKCLEGGVVFVSYDGAPDITPISDPK
mmetsp:Transcript_27555/g.82729  ORF Transcript_27555/g.82729 Transcript_27555/m.82729 type:complete len:193 (-) Transcript_27555:53-631(-)